MDKALVLADRLKKLKDQVDSLATKQTEIQTIKGDQGPKGEQGDRGFDGAPGLDGRDGKDGKDGAQGKDGVSVVKAEIAFDGSLVLYLSNGDQIDCGEVTPEKSKEVFQTIKNSGGSSPIDIFTAVLPGLVPASGGGTTNFLRADGTFAAPPAATPASPTTSVQFNNGGAFGGSANFTYNTGTNTFTVGPAGATTIIETLAPTGATVAGTLRLLGRNASATNGAGGGLQFVGGNALGTGTGGGISFTAGSSPSGLGGSIGFNASAGASGGSLEFNSGTGVTGPAGNVVINAAPGSGATSNGGTFVGTAGNAANNGNGGGITLLSGSSLGSGLGGNFDFRCGFGAGGSGSMSFSTDNFTIIQLTENGTPEAQIGFYGVTPVAKPAPTASGTQAVLDSVVTSLNSLGLVDSAALTNATVITPAGADTQIQYNDAGVLGANANFTYSSALNTLSLGPEIGTATFTTRAPGAFDNPSTLVIASQNSIRTAGTSPGGALTLRSGNGRPTGAGAGGAVTITSGNAGTTGVGGAINITAGAGGTTSGNGGAINILGGSRTSGTGGAVTIQSGPAANLFLNGGNNPSGNGGAVRGQGGQGSGAGVANGGSFQFIGGQANGAGGGAGGSLIFSGGTGGASGAGGSGGSATFNNGAGGLPANTDGDVFFYLTTSSSAPGSILLNSSFSTSAIEITRNAGTSATEIGFFNAVPVAQPAAVPVTAAGIHAALVSLGLIS